MRECGERFARVPSVLVFVLGLVVAGLVMPRAAISDVANLEAIKDNTIYEEHTNYSNGAGDYFVAGSTGGLLDYAVRGLIEFDIAGQIPAGATITSAQLTLYLSRSYDDAGPTSVRLHRLTASWGEGTSDAFLPEDGVKAHTNDATWIERFYGTSSDWTTPGGDFEATSSAATTVNDVGYYSWSSPEMVADVQGWLDDDGSNHGWIIRGQELVSTTLKRYDSRTHPTAAQRPVLTVEYTPPVTSPGIVICGNPGTMHDVQTIDDGQRAIVVAETGSAEPYVHFAWTHWDQYADDFYRSVRYNGYGTLVGLCEGDCGEELSGAGEDPVLAYGGYASIDLGSDPGVGALAHVGFHQRDQESQLEDPVGPFSAFVADQAVPCYHLWDDNDSLPEPEEIDAQCVHLGIDRAGTLEDDVYHVTAHPSGEVAPYDDEVLYWRRVEWDGSPGVPWEGPVVLDISAGHLNHHVAVDPTDPNVAVIYTQDQTPGNPNELLQIVYMQSAANGADWIADGVPIFPSPLTSLPAYDFVQVTSYSDPGGPEAWRECTGEFDLEGALHVFWVEQAVAGVGSECRIMHWDDGTGMAHTVVEALGFLNTGSNGVYDLWLAAPQVAFGDGSTTCSDNPAGTNHNYMYLTYEQYGGATPEESGDVSLGGYQNLEIYLTGSADGGFTWAAPVNLTNTKTPGCAPGDCLSERDPSLAMTVNDTLHILYVSDADAGDAVFGQGSWTYSDVMYYRIPGAADDPLFCPPVPACLCPKQGDANDFGVEINVNDVTFGLEILFEGDIDIQDPFCPTTRTDFDADGFANVVDISLMIDHVFSGGDGPTDPCTCPGGFPCASSYSAPPGNSVVVTSQTIGPNEMQAPIPILLTNDVALRSIVVPLVLREVTPGAFPTALKLSWRDRLPTVEGAPLSSVKYNNEYWFEDGACKDGSSGGFGMVYDGDTIAGPIPGSPVGVLFSATSIPPDPPLAPGTDVSGSLVLWVYTPETEGTFEIDTTCADPANHLLFVENPLRGPGIIPEFTPGEITIGSAVPCPHQSDFDEDGFVTALDMASEIDALFSGGPDPTDLGCASSRGDFDCDGFNTALDLAGLIDHLFAGGPGPCDPNAR